MILTTRYANDGQPWTWVDVDTRTVHDLTPGAVASRPLTDAEVRAVNVLLEIQSRVQAGDALRSQLAAGVAALEQARTDAAADVNVATDARTAALATQAQAVAQRAQVAGWVPGATYRASDLAAIRDQLAAVLDRQALICGAIAGVQAYRVSVDQNAVTTDGALLWLAQLAAQNLDTLGAI